MIYFAFWSKIQILYSKLNILKNKKKKIHFKLYHLRYIFRKKMNSGRRKVRLRKKGRAQVEEERKGRCRGKKYRQMSHFIT